MATIDIVGMGLVSCLGSNADQSWQGMLAGKDGFRALDRFPLDDYTQTNGGQLSTDAEEALRDELPEDDLACAMILKAAREALGEIPLQPDAGLVLATNFGFMETKEWCWRERVDVGEMDADTYARQHDPAEQIATMLKLDGPRTQLSLSCASGAGGVALAGQWLRAGRCNTVLVVCYDALTEFCWTGLSNLRTITDDRLRPFDVSRHGTIFSEGAAALLLTTEEACGRDVLARLLGAATNNNAYHLTAPAKGAEGSRKVMAAALEAAGIDSDKVDLISAHATGTTANDVTESAAIKVLVQGRSVPVAAFKSSFGHMLGAAGLAEIITTVMSLRDGVVPPVLNLQEQDKECDVDVVAGEPRKGSFRVAVTNSAGIGGNNAATVIGRADSVPVSADVTPRDVYLHHVGWVLPGSAEHGEALPKLDAAMLISRRDELTSFSVKPYIQSVKGYLDPAGAYALGAAALCLDGYKVADPDRAAVISATQYGATTSGYRFFEQMVNKGHRFASPMIFPHSYSNTAGNLVAIEWGWSGPHLVFDNAPDGTEALWAATDMLQRGLADDALVILYEAVTSSAVPDTITPLNGAICLRLGTDPAGGAGKLPFLVEDRRNHHGVVHAALR